MLYDWKKFEVGKRNFVFYYGKKIFSMFAEIE